MIVRRSSTARIEWLSIVSMPSLRQASLASDFQYFASIRSFSLRYAALLGGAGASRLVSYSIHMGWSNGPLLALAADLGLIHLRCLHSPVTSYAPVATQIRRRQDIFKAIAINSSSSGFLHETALKARFKVIMEERADSGSFAQWKRSDGP